MVEVAGLVVLLAKGLQRFLGMEAAADADGLTVAGEFCPAHAIGEDVEDVLVVVDRIGLVTGPEVEDLPFAALSLSKIPRPGLSLSNIPLAGPRKSAGGLRNQATVRNSGSDQLPQIR